MGSYRRALTHVSRILNSRAIATSTGRERSIVAGSFTGSEVFQPQLKPCNQNQYFKYIISRCSSINSSPTLPDIDLSNEESKRRLVNSLLYRSKQRGFLELDLVLGKWVEENIGAMDVDGFKALIRVLDLENPDLWKWLTGQEQPPEEVKMNLVFMEIQDKVMNNLNNHAAPETRAPPGQSWVRGWDDFKRGRDGPITGNQ